ncbi:MAG: Rrf2 family transcriptional regulator [Gemmatimonadetes bacterium]|nr:Rrf2 family transcriptional regulator [Gemmatimonadota bacterium]
MFGFTRRTDYALVALAGLADEPSPDPKSARSISERYGVPLPLLMNVLKDLVNGGIVSSTRGAKGGYSLARAPRGISVHDVVSAIEGPVSVTLCCDPAEAEPCQECSVEIHCPITHSVRRMNERIQDYLREVTLEHLMNDKSDVFAPTSRLVPVTSLRARIPARVPGGKGDS